MEHSSLEEARVKKQKIRQGIALVMGVMVAPMVMADAFDGQDMSVKWEVWDTTPIAKGQIDLLAVIEETNVTASNAATPDIKDFHSTVNNTGRKTTYELWDVDFNDNVIGLTYTSRYVGDESHQYMYSGPEGFHFEDTKGTLPDIIDVKVDTRYAPFGFEKSLVTFDANNIYVDLDGSMCHIDGMASMPDCANKNSPTGFDNNIKLLVSFAGGGSVVANDNGRIDSFFNWVEKIYPQFFPNHVESADLSGYHARYYPKTNVYLATKDGRLFVYGEQFKDLSAPANLLQDLGDVTQWFGTAGL